MKNEPSPQDRKLQRLSAFQQLDSGQQASDNAQQEQLFKMLQTLYGIQSDQQMLPEKLAELSSSSALKNATAQATSASTQREAQMLPDQLNALRGANTATDIHNRYLGPQLQGEIDTNPYKQDLMSAESEAHRANASNIYADETAGLPLARKNLLDAQGKALLSAPALSYLSGVTGRPGFESTSAMANPILHNLVPYSLPGVDPQVADLTTRNAALSHELLSGSTPYQHHQSIVPIFPNSEGTSAIPSLDNIRNGIGNLFGDHTNSTMPAIPLEAQTERGKQRMNQLRQRQGQTNQNPAPLGNYTPNLNFSF